MSQYYSLLSILLLTRTAALLSVAGLGQYNAIPDVACVTPEELSRAEELLDLLVPIDLPKSSSTWALIRRALRPSPKLSESSQAASGLGRRALRPRQAPSELPVWLSVTEELTGRRGGGSSCSALAGVAGAPAAAAPDPHLK